MKKNGVALIREYGGKIQNTEGGGGHISESDEKMPPLD